MKSAIVDALHLRYQPVCLIWADALPPDSLQFRENKWGCVMAMFAQVAGHGKTVAFDRKTFGCLGGGVGLGFGNQYLNWRGGIECFYGFLSTGNAKRENAEQIAEEIRQTGRKVAVERFLHGEGYVKNPGLARKFVNALPIVNIPAQYVILKPLRDLDEQRETPQIVILTANPDQLSALVSLANYSRGTLDNVVLRSGAGCQSIGILAYAESRSKTQRAIIGLTDLAARVYVSATLGHDVLTFAVPFKMFQELDSNVSGSFLEKDSWRTLTEAS